MRSVQVTGKTLEEAKAAAAQELGLSEDQVDVEVLKEPGKLLGLIGNDKYHIRATPIEQSEEEAQEEAAPQEPAEAEVGEAEEEFDEAEEAAEDISGQPQMAEAEPQDAQPAAEATEIAAAERDEQEPEEEPQEPADAERRSTAEIVAENALEIIDNITSMMGYDAEPTVREVTEDEVVIDLESEEAGNLIGRHGVTLDALQLVTAICANRGLDDGARVILDAEGYRQRREQMLENMAHSHAEKAKEAVKEVVIRDLKAYERRIVHLALADDPDVETYSEGSGSDRQLVISPKTE